MSEQTETAQSTAVVEDVGPSRKKLTITIPGEAVAEQIESAYDALSAEVALPGFRPGRVPRRLIEKRFAPNIQEEARNQLVSSAFSKAVEENKLAVLGDPEGGEELKDLTLEPGVPVTFSVEVEVPPDFETPDLSKLKVKKPVVEVGEEDVAKQLENIARAEGRLESQEKAEAGDYAIGRGVMRAAGEDEPVLDIEGAVIQVPAEGSDGKGAVLGVRVDDFAKQIGLPKPGDTLTIKTRGPEQHEDERIRGKDLEVTFEAERVERIVPLSVEEMVEKFGMADEQQLREAVMLRLNQRALLEQQNAMRQQVASHLIDTVEMELPEGLTAKQATRNIERQRMSMMSRGMDQQTIEDRLADVRGSSDELARRELKLFFILARIAEDMQIEITPDEVHGRIAQLAADRGMRPDELRQQLEQGSRMQMLAQQVREHKTLDAILTKAETEEVPVEEYNEEVRKRQGGEAQVVDVTG